MLSTVECVVSGELVKGLSSLKRTKIKKNSFYDSTYLDNSHLIISAFEDTITA